MISAALQHTAWPPILEPFPQFHGDFPHHTLANEYGASDLYPSRIPPCPGARGTFHLGPGQTILQQQPSRPCRACWHPRTKSLKPVTALMRLTVHCPSMHCVRPTPPSSLQPATKVQWLCLNSQGQPSDEGWRVATALLG